MFLAHISVVVVVLITIRPILAFWGTPENQDGQSRVKVGLCF